MDRKEKRLQAEAVKAQRKKNRKEKALKKIKCDQAIKNSLHNKKQVPVTMEGLESLFQCRGQRNHPLWWVYDLRARGLRGVIYWNADTIAATTNLFAAAASAHKFLEEGAELVSGVRLGAVLMNLVDLRKFWIRDPADWKPTHHNTRRKFGSLLRHLFAKYPTPEVLDSIFYSEVFSWLFSVYPVVAQGGNLKKAIEHVYPLTNRQAHLLLTVSNELTFHQALRWAQVVGLGGGSRLGLRIAKTFLAEPTFPADGVSEAFWISVLHWLVNNPMLSHDQIGPLLDYFRFSFDQNPYYTMKGRTPARALEDMALWHRNGARLLKQSAAANNFPLSGFQGGTFPVTEGGRVVTYMIEEILTNADLLEESRRLHHCAFSYSSSINRGECSLWSLRRWAEKKITIEVRNASRSIVQCRGLQNRVVDHREEQIISNWAGQNNLRYRRDK